MNYIDFEYKFDWTENTKWQLPADEVLFQSQFKSVNQSISKSIQYVKNKNICIQAGACIGLWPIKYSTEFSKVVTFEPLDITYQCALENIKRCFRTNIEIYNMPLGLGKEKVIPHYPKPETLARSYGAHRVIEDPNGVQVVTIDDLNLAVDHIQLDVEGYEHAILKGAEQTIKQYKPIITLEQRALHHAHKIYAAHMYLQGLGYIVIDKFNDDIIMKHAG